ncbi:hypothetical protein [Celeribacter sp. PS-C1]|uniref:hypothetical protein n=1 Tax=Celeribacter sp. PS-C1 TaxID=2820813 RepID=UPI001CA4D3B3|nr:hypothetical protein [Celeribacter sp. PS-C1]
MAQKMQDAPQNTERDERLLFYRWRWPVMIWVALGLLMIMALPMLVLAVWMPLPGTFAWWLMPAFSLPVMLIGLYRILSALRGRPTLQVRRGRITEVRLFGTRRYDLGQYQALALTARRTRSRRQVFLTAKAAGRGASLRIDLTHYRDTKGQLASPEQIVQLATGQAPDGVQKRIAEGFTPPSSGVDRVVALGTIAALVVIALMLR